MKKIIALTAALALMIGLCACSSKAEEPTWQERFDLGLRYLEEGNYQEAVLAFAAAIEIDPKRAETYERLADAYLALGDEDSALDALWDGHDATGDTRLRTRIDELAQPEPTPTPTPAPTPEPTPAANSGAGFVIENGVLVKYNGPGGEVTIPDEVTRIGERAFENCTRMTRVIFPEHSYSIDSYAFFWCTGLTYIENTGGIGEYAFAACTGLTEIVNSGGIGEYAFAGCTGLTYIENTGGIGEYAFAGCTGLTKLVNRGGIGEYAFAGCTRLSQIWLSSAGIGANAFAGCTALTDVYYSGTEAQWAAMNIGEGNEALLSAAIHFNS